MAGNDLIYTARVICGEAGDDHIVDVITYASGGDGIDTIHSTFAARIDGNAGADNLTVTSQGQAYGGDGNDSMVGGPVSVQIGGAGDDGLLGTIS